MKFNLNQLMSDQSKDAGGGERMIFKVEFIPIEKLHASKMNKYIVQDIEELKASIELMGLQQNLLVRDQNGGYEVISGHRRLKAMQELYAAGNEQFKEIPCKVTRTTDDVQAELQLLLANSTTRELTDYEKTYQASRLQELLEDLKRGGYKFTGRKREVVAQLMGVSSSQIARMDSINKKLSPELKEEFSEGHINITTAYELSKLPDDAQREVAAESKEGKVITPAVAKQKQKEVREPKVVVPDFDQENVLHHLKIHPEMFEAVASGVKGFEYRVNDRNYKVGDILNLNEWHPVEEFYTKRSIKVEVTFILEGDQYGVPAGYVIMSVKRR